MASLEKNETKLKIPKKIPTRVSRHHKAEALSNSMKLVPIEAAENPDYAGKAPEPVRKIKFNPPEVDHPRVSMNVTKSSFSNGVSFSPEQYSSSYRRLLSHMHKKEAGRLVNLRVEKQMRKYLKKWGHSAAKRETNKVQKYDLNSLRITNQANSLDKRSQYEEGSAVFSAKYIPRISSVRKEFNIEDDSSSSRDTEEEMLSNTSSEVETGTVIRPSMHSTRLNSIRKNRIKLAKNHKSFRKNLKSSMPCLIDFSREEPNKTGNEVNTKSIVNLKSQKMTKIRRPLVSFISETNDHSNDIDNVFTSCYSKEDIKKQITLSAFSRPEHIMNMPINQNKRLSKIEKIREKQRMDRVKLQSDMNESMRNQAIAEINEMISTTEAKRKCNMISAKTLQKAYYIPEKEEAPQEGSPSKAFIYASRIHSSLGLFKNPFAEKIKKAKKKKKR